MAINIQFRRGTASEWTAANPTLAVAEFGVETDTDKFKLGDGATAWTSLAYGGIKGDDGTSGVAAATAPLAYNSGTSTVSIDLSAYDTSAEVDTKLADYDTSAEVDTKLADYDTSAQVDTKLADYDTSAQVDTKLSQLESDIADNATDILARALLTPSLSAKTGAYTLVAGDKGSLITGSGTFTFTAPSGTFASGDRVDFVNVGTGVLTFAGSGVTVNSVDSALTIDTQWASATLLFTSASVAVLIGKLA